MNKFFGGIVGQFQEFYKSLGPTKRMALVTSVFIGIIAIGAVVFMASGKDYAVLLTNVPPEQVPVIIEKLNSKNIPYQLRDDGKTVTVPKDFLHATQMQLMSEVGSSKMGSMGLEIFDKQEFGVNSYTQKINYQRALQGELIRAINTLSAVKQSKVILALPAKKTMLEESAPPSASVVVELHAGKELSQDQVRGIRYLVANAVEGMDAERVTILDDRGKMISRVSEGVTGASSEIMEHKARVERDFESRIESILSKVVGHGKVVAKVDATVNHKVITSVEESVDPDRTAIRSQTTQEESLDGARTNPVGIPGSRSNIPGAEDGSGQVGFKQDVKKELKTVNYDVPKTVKNIKEAAGAVEKITVAVLIDGVNTTVTNADGTSTNSWAPRTAEEIAKYESLVKNAVGFSPQRGDSVKIESIQFQVEDFSDSERLLTNIEKKKLVQSLMKWGLLGFSLLLFFFMVVRPFMQWITDSFTDSVEEMLPRTLEELEELHSVDNSLPGLSSVLPILQESIDPEKAESELLKDRILALMQKDEEKASSAINMWVARKE
ncbi:flagellar basal-body MS-ring/collar protein FliF [Pseudobdellovibrio exovorus]|uniref:Flagellar M-ring protein n=1 Tax=Pseudobdellovibrio exovorus JSS TaxID=1184267 RepID=M4VAC7_9BACT|nr:flagellar basal-body MS-ring/collar protein FliF [Pseudobdellovibrio exovorus]AGH96362.1 flagellar M-ring protein [Pseudobdellovibrio exovorus JSS]